MKTFTTLRLKELFFGSIILFFGNIMAQSTYVPDDNFEAYLEANGMGNGIPNDDYVLTSNINYITDLIISNKNISDLTGIEDFVALERLDCENNNLTSLDLWYNTNLKVIECNFNNIGVIDFFPYSLEKLYCWNNNLSWIDVTNANNLEVLICGENPNLNYLDISQNINLRQLDVRYTSLNYLDVYNNTLLEDLNCSGLNLQQIDLTNNSHLKELDVSFTNISTLDVTNCPDLEYLSCFGNHLSYIDLSMNQKLIEVQLTGNYLTHFECPSPVLTLIECAYSNLQSIDVTANYYLKNLIIQGNNLTSLDVSANPYLELLNCRYNEITSLDLTQNVLLKKVYANHNDLTNFTIKNGNNTLITSNNFDVLNNTYLSCIEVDDVSYSNTYWSSGKDAWAFFSTNCGNKSSGQNILIPQTKTNDFHNNISISPNPTYGMFNIQVLNQSIQKVQVLDLQGRLIKQVSSSQIDISDLTDSVYFLVIYTDEDCYVRQIIKK